MDANDVVRRLGLLPHPEGGFYRETYRSALTLDLPDGRRRAAATAIHYLLPAGAWSTWHRVASDEIWHHYDGGALRLHLLGAGTRRLWSGDTLVLLCHASPGSQTAGLPADLDGPTLVQRVTRSDARVIACGHTHVADVRELGRKLIVNPGSCGWALDDDPRAGWAMLTIDDEGLPSAELHRVAYDAEAVANEVSDRGLPGDVYRAATIRNGRLVR